jgi:hypothetical protein
MASVSIDDLCWCCKSNKRLFDDVDLEFGVDGEPRSEQLGHVTAPLLSESAGNTYTAKQNIKISYYELDTLMISLLSVFQSHHVNLSCWLLQSAATIVSSPILTVVTDSFHMLSLWSFVSTESFDIDGDFRYCEGVSSRLSFLQSKLSAEEALCWRYRRSS